MQDEHVFRIPFLRRFGEIVRTCYGTHDVHYHELVVHELMLTVIPHPDAMFPQAAPCAFRARRWFLSSTTHTLTLRCRARMSASAMGSLVSVYAATRTVFCALSISSIRRLSQSAPGVKHTATPGCSGAARAGATKRRRQNNTTRISAHTVKPNAGQGGKYTLAGMLIKKRRAGAAYINPTDIELYVSLSDLFIQKPLRLSPERRNV